jgi:hypothetical protein
MKITPKLFEAHLKCPTKCRLRAAAEPTAGNVYAEWLQSQNESYRAAAISRLMAERPADECAVDPPAETLKTAMWQIAMNVTVASEPRSSRGSEAQTSSPPASRRDSQPNDQSLLTSAATMLDRDCCYLFDLCIGTANPPSNTACGQTRINHSRRMQ